MHYTEICLVWEVLSAYTVGLTFTTLLAYSADDKLIIFSEIGFDISCKLSSDKNLYEMPKPVFWGKKISNWRLLNFLPSMQC